MCVRIFQLYFLVVLMSFENLLHCRRLLDPFNLSLDGTTFNIFLNVNHCLIPLMVGKLKRLSLASLNLSSSSASSCVLNLDSFSSDLVFFYFLWLLKDIRFLTSI